MRSQLRPCFLLLNSHSYTKSVTIGYFEAWRMWLAGQQVPGDATMWFMSVRWWGRLGKVLCLVAGGTVLLDIIGPQRLRSFAEDRQQVWDIFRSLFIGRYLWGWGLRLAKWRPG
jgi:hypothetical protein